MNEEIFNVFIEQVSFNKPDYKGVKIGGKWRTVAFPAVKYLPSITTGNAKISLNDKNEIIYIEQVNKGKPMNVNQQSKPYSPSEEPKESYWANKESRDLDKEIWLKQQGCFNSAIEILRSRGKEFSLQEVTEVAKLIYEQFEKGDVCCK